MSEQSRDLRQFLTTSQTRIEFELTGSVDPTTVIAHSLGGSIESVKPLGAGLPGSQAYFHFRGHGGSSTPREDWDYAALSHELKTVAGHVGATRAIGVSMGAGAILRLLETEPTRFERIALLIPAVLDQPRDEAALRQTGETARLAVAGDIEGLIAQRLRDVPPQDRTRADVIEAARERARLVTAPGICQALQTIPRTLAMTDRTKLQQVEAPVLVIAQRGDAAHPVHITEEIGRLIPHARVEILPSPGLLDEHIDHVRQMVGSFMA